jgi:outer membrane biogenesis lipoprotein LolB
MKKLIFLLLIVILLASCATTNVRKPGHTNAYDTYKHRKQIVKENQQIKKQGFIFGACKKKH